MGAKHGPAAASAAPSPVCVFDMHCHLDFAPDARAAASSAAIQGIGALSVTVAPAGYTRAARELASFSNVRVGLGLHPWWIADGLCGEDDVAAFERLAPDERFIGEVGLDFGRARAAAREAQLAAFDRVAAACSGGGKVLSIHAVKAAGEALDVLERRGALAGNACVFHWFSGTSDQLQRAVRLGCRFSINPRMLETKRGRAYARSLPADRLLLESDAPAEAGAAYDADAVRIGLARTTERLAELRGESCDELSARIACSSGGLLSQPSRVRAGG